MTQRLVTEAHKIAPQLFYYAQRAEAEKLRDYSNRLLKTWLFIAGSISVFLFITLMAFAGTIGSVFFKSMILWKGIKLDFPFLDKISDAVKEIATFLRIPGF